MPKIGTKIELPKRTRRIYSDEELRIFDGIMEKFRKPLDFTDINGEEVHTTMIDPRDYYVSQGAMKIKKHLGVDYHCVVVDYYGDDPTISSLEYLEDKVNQWNTWKVRNSFVEKLKLDTLQKSADQVDFSVKNW